MVNFLRADLVNSILLGSTTSSSSSAVTPFTSTLIFAVPPRSPAVKVTVVPVLGIVPNVAFQDPGLGVTVSVTRSPTPIRVRLRLDGCRASVSCSMTGVAGGEVAGGEVAGAAETAGGEVAGGEVAGGEVAGGEVAGGEVAGGEVAGGEVAGGEVAGGEVAGGEVAGGEVAGGEVAGGEVAGGEVAGGEVGGHGIGGIRNVEGNGRNRNGWNWDGQIGIGGQGQPGGEVAGGEAGGGEVAGGEAGGGEVAGGADGGGSSVARRLGAASVFEKESVRRRRSALYSPQGRLWPPNMPRRPLGPLCRQSFVVACIPFDARVQVDGSKDQCCRGDICRGVGVERGLVAHGQIRGVLIEEDVGRGRGRCSAGRLCLGWRRRRWGRGGRAGGIRAAAGAAALVSMPQNFDAQSCC